MASEGDAETASAAAPQPLFVDIDPDNPVTEIQSLCMNCHEQGTTRLLLTRIPHFREIVLMAFECPHCGFKNNEVQSAGSVAEKGLFEVCRVEDEADMNRQIVKMESCAARVPELDFEIPARSQPAMLTTVEGLLKRAVEALSAEQPVRKIMEPELHDKIQGIVEGLGELIELKRPFHIELDDPSGNSYIESLTAPLKDKKIASRRYERTPEQNEMLGLNATEAEPEVPQDAEAAAVTASAKQLEEDEENLPEVLQFHTNCSNCTAPNDTRMHVISIPYFKEVVIMASSCDSCGFKSNEVKAGGAIAEQGRRITLKVTEAEDLTRDVLKSETCGLSIPEVELELTPGTLGGQFTTLEGLLIRVRDELETRNPFSHGDSVDQTRKAVFANLIRKLTSVINMEVVPWTLVLDDPAANSYLQNLYAPDPDPNMTIEDYDRTWEQNEMLGLNDMHTDRYGTEENAEGEEGDGVEHATHEESA
ncbi:ZPR1 zinc-finger domain-containing protein [Hyaloraphidium curvatum]|nr:ZPR1 zinc-finger domain-containing protein [Hyaloraphidium curvatum]